MNKYRSGGKTTPKAKVAAKPKAKVAAKPKKAYQSGGVAKAKPKASPKAKSDGIGPLTEREKFLIQQAREADMDRKMQEAAARHQKTRLKPKGYARGGGIDQFGRGDPSINRYFPSQPPRSPMSNSQPPRTLMPMGNSPSTQAPTSVTPQAPSYDKGVVGPGTMPTRQPAQLPPRAPMGMASVRSGRSSSPMNMDRPRLSKRSRRTR
jgi:hypothetical protein